MGDPRGPSNVTDRRSDQPAVQPIPTLNRSQALVLGFLAAAWVTFLVILVVAPETYGRVLNTRPAPSAPEIGFGVTLTVFLAVLALGVVRRWRWLFWLLLLAFLAGPLRTIASGLELAGIVSEGNPLWYVLLQGAIGIVQLAIGLALVRGYRRGGAWAAF